MPIYLHVGKKPKRTLQPSGEYPKISKPPDGHENTICNLPSEKPKNSTNGRGETKEETKKKHTPLTEFSLSELRRLSWGMMGYYTKSCQSIKHMENPVRKTPKEWGWRWFCRTRESACWLAGWLAGYQGRWQSDPNRHEQTLSPIANSKNTHQKHTQSSVRVNPKNGTSIVKQYFILFYFSLSLSLSLSFGQKCFFGVF